MLRFGLLGAGRIGQVHGKNIATNPRAKLVAIYDPFEDAANKLAAETGAQVRDMDKIIKGKDIDVVVICTPTDTHADLIDRSAKAGKAVFCEKPVDLDVKRVEKTLKLVEKLGTPLMVGFNRRFDCLWVLSLLSRALSAARR